MKIKNFSLLFAWAVGLNLLLLGACETQPKKETEPEAVKATAERIASPKDIIPLKEAKQLCENYENRRIPGIAAYEAELADGEATFVPTQFVAFDLNTIKDYIKYVEQEAAGAKVTPDSLRIYFANYGKKGQQPFRNTMFILPTAKLTEGYGGFYIDAKGQAKLMRNYWGDGSGNPGDNKSKASFMPSFSAPMLQGGGSLVLNHGHSGPPPGGDF